jgi:micrococcal nuclease
VVRLARTIRFALKARLVLSLLLFACASQADDFRGRAVGISDGDTISVMHDGRAKKIRLNGIDAPEKGQPFSNRAKEFVSSMVFGQDVTVQVRGRDRYGRTIGEVTLSDGRSLNHEIVKAGFAWSFRRYAPNDAELEKLEPQQGKVSVACGQTESRCHLGSGEG